jgi:hypothetical protein
MILKLARSEWWQEWGVLAVVALCALPLFTPRVYASDEVKYFSTLRSIYMDRDLHYENEYGYFIGRDPVAHAGLLPYKNGLTPTGYRLNDAPIGSAILWAPFYILADGVVVVGRALGSSVPRDGYSRPYVWAVCLASLFWGLAGLALTYRLCRAHVGRAAATWGVLAVWFASPLVFYLYITPAMAHASSLFAVALFLWYWHRTRSERSIGQWIILGASAGLMVLVRELNWLGLLVIGVDELHRLITAGRAGLGPALTMLTRRSAGYLSFWLTVGAVVAPQFYVYHTLNGTFGPTPFVVEKFSTLPIHTIDVLFSGFHGLFSWHPVTLVAVVGLVTLWLRSPVVALAGGAFFVAQVLVVGSYDTWPGGASFGARRFVNCTPVFALGLASLFEWLRVRSGVERYARVAVSLLVVWNFGLAIQYATGLIPRDAPVQMSRIVRNQFVEVAPRVAQIARRFAFDRSSFYRTKS